MPLSQDPQRWALWLGLHEAWKAGWGDKLFSALGSMKMLCLLPLRRSMRIQQVETSQPAGFPGRLCSVEGLEAASGSGSCENLAAKLVQGFQ